MSEETSRRYEGIVLLRETAGERHLRLVLLDAEHGLVRCLYKPASKSGAGLPAGTYSTPRAASSANDVQNAPPVIG